MKIDILLVNDAKVFNHIVSRVTSLTGMKQEIECASSSQEALDLLNKYFIGGVQVDNILFVKLEMPVLEGFQFIDAFKRIVFPHKRKVSVVILLDTLTSNDKEQANRLGIKHCINRPMSDEDLRSIFF